MRQPMLRWRMFRHGAHHENISSLSGLRTVRHRPVHRPASGRTPRARRAAGQSRPSLRSFGCRSRSVCATLRSPHSTSGCPRATSDRRPAGKLLEERHLGRVVLAAVGHINRRDQRAIDDDGGHAGLEVKRRVVEHRRQRRDVLADKQRHARIAAGPVPVAPVPLGLVQHRRQLVGLGLDLLQADDVRAVAGDPVDHLRVSCADAVDVPGRDSHSGRS